MRFFNLKTGLMIAALVALFGCSEPPVPSEVPLAFSQEQDLWRAGASVFAPDDYTGYRISLETSRSLLNTERARFVWFQDYDKVRSAFVEVLQKGDALGKKIQGVKDQERSVAMGRLEEMEGSFRLLRGLSAELKDNRFNGRYVAKAEVDLVEARRLITSGDCRAAGAVMDRADRALKEKVRLVGPLLQRFTDNGQIRRWQGMVNDTIADSKKSQGLAIVISKLERQLTLYRGGKEIRRFQVGFGFNMLSDKLHSGDKATPEGCYKVISKNQNSRYYRALLIDYPNAEDRQRYQAALRRGQIPRWAGLGSLIEIHGGGRTGLTNGCVALENEDMDTLFAMIAPGTPVTIVGTQRPDKGLLVALRNLK